MINKVIFILIRSIIVWISMAKSFKVWIPETKKYTKATFLTGTHIKNRWKGYQKKRKENLENIEIALQQFEKIINNM